MLLMWVIFALLYSYIQSATQNSRTFDPFEILGVTPSSTDPDIKKAYRRLSLQFHPDKNPDPAATEYFAEYITKAYKALTDQTSKENFKKYGHPDGPQAMTVSVALPEWFFSKDKRAAPVILLILLLGGIVIPIGFGLWYLVRKQKFQGPNGLMQDTMQLFFHPPVGIKEAQAVGRIPETLVCAAEFILLRTPKSQQQAMDALRQSVIDGVDASLAGRAGFWKRRVSVVKVHLLILAHCSRLEVRAPLQKDLMFVLEKSPLMLQEMFKISVMHRYRPAYGWLTPAIACVEMMQCLFRAVPVAARKATLQSRSGEGDAWLLQLPGFTKDTIRSLIRQKVKSLAELQAMDPADRRAILALSELRPSFVEQVQTALTAMPTLWVTARCIVIGPSGEEDTNIHEGDHVTCRIKAVITRPGHMAYGFDARSIQKGKHALAYAPQYPYPVEEHWFFVLGNPGRNLSVAHARRSLVEAESIGAKEISGWIEKAGEMGGITVSDGSNNNNDNNISFKSLTSRKKYAALVSSNMSSKSGSFDPFSLNTASATNDDNENGELGQTIEIKFIAPEAGKHDLLLYCLPDAWLGCDRTVPIKMTVSSASKVDPDKRFKKEGGGLERSEESEMLGGEDGDDESDAGDDDEDDDDNGDGASYDSDEFGSEETDDEEGE